MTRLLLALATLLAAVAILATPAHAAVVVCKGGTDLSNSTCKGTDKPDTITGSPIEDLIYGKGGGDQITDTGTGGFYDQIHGGGGADTIIDKADAADSDEVFGEGGSDDIDVQDGGSGVVAADYVSCGDGTDTVKADGPDHVDSNCENVIRG